MDYFKTMNKNLVITLICYGYEVTFIKDPFLSIPEFQIIRDKKFDEYIQLYFTRQLTVEPIEFSEHCIALDKKILNTCQC